MEVEYYRNLYEETIQDPDFYLSVSLRKWMGNSPQYLLEIYKLVSLPWPAMLPEKEVLPLQKSQNEDAQMIRIAIKKFDEEVEKLRKQHETKAPVLVEER